MKLILYFFLVMGLLALPAAAYAGQTITIDHELPAGQGVIGDGQLPDGSVR